MSLFESVRLVEEHMEDADQTIIVVQDRRDAYWILAYSGEMERLFYQGIPEGDEDGNRTNDATGWLLDGIMTDGPSWPLRLMVPAEDPIDDDPCDAEMWSWDYFRHQQVDAYWMRCHRVGKHDEHENSETGAHWPVVSSGDPWPDTEDAAAAHYAACNPEPGDPS